MVLQSILSEWNEKHEKKIQKIEEKNKTKNLT